MAVVHPSRMALVPKDTSKIDYNSDSRRNGASSSVSKPYRERQNRDRSRSRGHSSSRERSYDAREDRSRDRRRSPDPRGHRDHNERSHRDERGRRSRSRGREEREFGRRSPEYDAYKRPPERSNDQPPPWKQPQNMYPSRGGNGRGVDMGSSSDWLESRRIERAQSTLSIWPPSPTEEERKRFLSPERKSKKRSRRDRSESPSSEEDDKKKRRERKGKKHRKDKEKEREREKRRDHEHRKEKRKHRHRSRHSDEDESEDDRERYRRDRRSHERSEHRSRRDVDDDSADRGRSRGEKEVGRRREEHDKSRSNSSSERGRSGSATISRNNEEASPRRAPIVDYSLSQLATLDGVNAPQTADDSDDEVGPQPIIKATITRKVDEREYGGALLRGEGSAMAAFLQEGGTEARIPRRGEIGLTSDEIAAFEAVGYVMSGSRHKRMNAVRMRKENQVISAEEKRAILKLQKEEKERREAILREEFKQLVDEKLKGVATKKVE